MWPACIEFLTTSNIASPDEFPSFLINDFIKEGITEQSEMFIPLRIDKILGKCGTHKFMDCPNVPEWHLENSQDTQFWRVPEDYFESTGEYYWFDFDMFDSNKNTTSLRTVFNEGDADCNDGTWGASWDRNTEELVANFTSIGDCEANIEVVSKQHIASFRPHNIWLPLQNNNSEVENPLPFTIHYANNFEIEKLIGIAMRWCGACVRM